jgi:ribosomal protein L19E
MAEVLIKAELVEGDIIHAGFNSAKSEIRIRIQKKKEDREQDTGELTGNGQDETGTP